MHKYALGVILLTGCFGITAGAQQSSTCSLQVKAEDNGLSSLDGKPPGPASLFSPDVSIGSFHLKFVDAKTHQPLQPSKLTLAYGWNWLQYPYPEHLWGAWSEASDIVDCENLAAAEITVPQFVVKPRGWYAGTYTKFPYVRKPSFTGIDVAVTLTNCSPRVTIAASEAEQIAGKVATVNVDCHGKSTVSVQK